MMKINCKYCGKEFNKRPCELLPQGHFCSRKCQSDYSLSVKYVKRICPICKEEFDALKCEVDRGKGMYCSLKCLGAHNKIRTGSLNPSWKGGREKRICRVCGEEFQPRNYQIKLGGGIVCSNACKGIYYKATGHGKHVGERIEKVCLMCGEIFKVPPHRKAQKTCSKICCAAYASQFNKYRDNKVEKVLGEILDDIGIKYEHQKMVQKVSVDFFVPPNIVIFADGDYWHKYPIGTERDRFCNGKLKESGFGVLRFWERDIKNNPSFIKETIMENVN